MTEQQRRVHEKELERIEQVAASNGDAILHTEAAALAAGVSEGTIRAAFRAGDLEGRDVGGSAGILTTWQSLLKWARGGEKKEAGNEQA